MTRKLISGVGWLGVGLATHRDLLHGQYLFIANPSGMEFSYYPYFLL